MSGGGRRALYPHPPPPALALAGMDGFVDLEAITQRNSPVLTADKGKETIPCPRNLSRASVLYPKEKKKIFNEWDPKAYARPLTVSSHNFEELLLDLENELHRGLQTKETGGCCH
ncbi:hypothetical protein TWF706_004364 [Orbilia oligospora]|nr:hypothetical protein TWF706_004364 [Orbilia oligospora]